MAINPRCESTGSAATSTSFSVPLTGWTNAGAGVTGTAPAPGDIVFITGIINNTLQTVTQTAGTGSWTFHSSGVTGTGDTAFCAFRVFTGIETAPTFGWTSTARYAYAVIALTPDPGYAAGSIDIFATDLVDATAGTTHTPNPATATQGPTDLSLLLSNGATQANGTSPVTFSGPASWTIPSGGSVSNTGAASTKGYGSAVAYQQGVTGTVTPGAQTIEGGSSSTGSTTAIIFHVLVNASPVPGLPPGTVMPPGRMSPMALAKPLQFPPSYGPAIPVPVEPSPAPASMMTPPGLMSPMSLARPVWYPTAPQTPPVAAAAPVVTRPQRQAQPALRVMPRRCLQPGTPPPPVFPVAYNAGHTVRTGKIILQRQLPLRVLQRGIPPPVTPAAWYAVYRVKTGKIILPPPPKRFLQPGTPPPPVVPAALYAGHSVRTGKIVLQVQRLGRRTAPLGPPAVAPAALYAGHSVRTGKILLLTQPRRFLQPGTPPPAVTPVAFLAGHSVRTGKILLPPPPRRVLTAGIKVAAAAPAPTWSTLLITRRPPLQVAPRQLLRLSGYRTPALGATLLRQQRVILPAGRRSLTRGQPPQIVMVPRLVHRAPSRPPGSPRRLTAPPVITSVVYPTIVYPARFHRAHPSRLQRMPLRSLRTGMLPGFAPAAGAARFTLMAMNRWQMAPAVRWQAVPVNRWQVAAAMARWQSNPANRWKIDPK